MRIDRIFESILSGRRVDVGIEDVEYARVAWAEMVAAAQQVASGACPVGQEREILQTALDRQQDGIELSAMPDPLTVARAAWGELLAAEYEQARLRRYTHHSAQMRDDMVKWSVHHSEAREALNKALGYAP